MSAARLRVQRDSASRADLRRALHGSGRGVFRHPQSRLRLRRAVRRHRSDVQRRVPDIDRVHTHRRERLRVPGPMMSRPRVDEPSAPTDVDVFSVGRRSPLLGLVQDALEGIGCREWI